MKFRILLWLLGRLMSKASRSNPAFQQQLAGKDLTFQLHTLDGKVARHFVVKNQRIRSCSGACAQPAFALGFRDAACGYATLTARDKQSAFLRGIQNRDIRIKGNPLLLIWFQGLTRHLLPVKKTD
ncbi:helicase [Pseudomonas sp. N040]|uniref:helicase n=1 Tax=Pseudomonas sp. N040 TaxID=2785325 RepID=UPI0018A2B222|nr:helicase [Pseudomonas sp. N040]MBF7728740.1 helicase [Pseudomonas sp. N040]MBW7012380.1 helicase [Pseudomonas sp. N040]